ncbi:Crp/Fnr family transcriptional regulator [Ilyobacter sp.]|uniref:Crp/Fnr family transcriptional regulator n=1 Tax=Ilyobacter sp. TaxID=3100343 RepID=UPI003563BD3D
MTKKSGIFKHYEEITEILNKISIFGGLSQEQLKRIFPLLKKKKYKQGEFIFKKGDSPENIYIIQSGKVKIVEEMKEETFQIVEFDTGDCFGETELIGIFPYIASAVVSEDAVLIILNKKNIYSLSKEDIKLFSMVILNIARESCRRLAVADKDMFRLMREYKQSQNL